jgi:hypothetical protein
MGEIQRLRKQVASLKVQVDKLQAAMDSKSADTPSAFSRFLASPFTQGVSVLVALAVALSGKLDTAGTEIAVGIAFVIGAFGIYTHSSRTLRQKIIAGVLVLIYGAGLWRFNNYLITRAERLTQQQKNDFTAILKTILAVPDYVEIACPESDEPTCIYTATFIPLFQRAGWKVDGPQVQRVKLATPTASVVLVAFGPIKTGKELQNPDVGVWTHVNPWNQLLTTAFVFVVHAHIEQWNDPTMRLDRIRVYFGAIPKS